MSKTHIVRWALGTLLLGSSLLAAGCLTPPDDLEQSSTPHAGEVLDEDGDVHERGEPLNAAGGTCAGTCDKGLGYSTCYPGYRRWVDVCRPNVTVNCRRRIIEQCRARGWKFVDARWVPECAPQAYCVEEPRPLEPSP